MRAPRIGRLVALVAFSLSVFAQNGPRAELGLAYDYGRSNTPPSGCGCFSMNGGSVSLAWRLRPRISLAGDIGVLHAGSVTSAGHDLTLSTFQIGPRFYFLEKKNRTELALRSLTPFAHVLIGGAHASGTLSGTGSGSSNGFVFTVGGGVDMGLNRRIRLRLLQTEYLLTTIRNGVNDRQNSLQLRTGVVIRLK